MPADDLRTLALEAQAAGLVLGKCHVCDGQYILVRRGDCDVLPYQSDFDSGEWIMTDCPACGGTGRDLTPGGILMALTGAANLDIISRTVYVTCRDSGAFRVADHDGTPAGLAAAALRVWIAARRGA